MDYRIVFCSEYSQNDLKELVGLFNASFPKCDFSEDYYKWQYLDNPNGRVLSYNAMSDKGKLVSHYAAIPIKMLLNGKIELGLLSLNTATHPAHQGNRLFTTLAKKTYSKATELGYKFVIGVANANSTHGFLKNLNFYLVAPLEFKVGFGDIYKYSDIIDKQRVWYDDIILKWRLKNPCFNYFISGKSILGSRKEPFFHTSVGRISSCVSSVPINETTDIFNIYIGLGLNKKGGFYINLPHFIKRSPFNLIFRDLTCGSLPIITKDNIFFQLLDFDVS